LDYYEEKLLGNIPTEGRILVEEYYKALYMNDGDPEKYNFPYWVEYFKVSNVTLRNAFNYIFFPIADPNNPTEIGKILHFKDIDLQERRKLIAEMSSEEYKNYLENTDERPELQEIKRLDYINYQKSAKIPRISNRTIPHTDEDLEDLVDFGLIKSDVIRDIDKKIGEFVTNKIEYQGLILDKDVKLKLDEIREKRKLLDEEYYRRIAENPELIETGEINEENENENENKKVLESGKVKLISNTPNKENGLNDFNNNNNNIINNDKEINFEFDKNETKGNENLKGNKNENLIENKNEINLDTRDKKNK
jgi:hypothetical protein